MLRREAVPKIFIPLGGWLRDQTQIRAALTARPTPKIRSGAPMVAQRESELHMTSGDVERIAMPGMDSPALEARKATAESPRAPELLLWETIDRTIAASIPITINIGSRPTGAEKGMKST